MTAVEKIVNDLYENLKVYDFDQKAGWIRNDQASIKKCIYVANLLIDETKKKFWYDVLNSLKSEDFNIK